MKVKRLVLLVCLMMTIIYTVSCSTKRVNEDAHFIHYNSSFYAETGTDYNISITYILKKDSDDYIEPSQVESIRFKQSKNVEVKSFEFYKSESSTKYQVKNIELGLHFSNTGEEKLTDLEIFFKDKTSKSYPIGDWYFNVENKDPLNKSPIEMGQNYAVVSAFFDGYLVNLINNSKETVKVNAISINLKDVQLLQTPLDFDASGKLFIKIPASIKDSLNKFYIVRPKIEYTLNGEKHNYYPYASVYGVINLTEKDFDNEYNRPQ
ncbi:hypothetical protein [Paenibacillus harenae]|uniref:hypothetical protein n=1 Tax=Paenibacillus harenae TaxID=306543 RepID=UPI0012EBB9BA|nr:hypothetical protein [Paenibacillus harenae]